MRGQYRFGVKLKATNAVFVTAYGHGHGVVLGTHHQLLRGVDANQRMITRNGQGIGLACKHGQAVVLHLRRFAVQNFARAAHFAAVSFNQRLMPQTNADDGHFAAHQRNQFDHATCFGRFARTRR